MFEYYVEEGHSVTLAIHSEFKLFQLYLDCMSANLQNLALDKTKLNIHLRAEA